MKKKFIEALKKQYRFKTRKGLLNLEQLFQLGKKDLDEAYKRLQDEKSKSRGLLDEPSTADQALDTKLALVKLAFVTLVEEEKKKLAEDNKKRKKEILLNAAAKKEVKELTKGKTSKELIKAAKQI